MARRPVAAFSLSLLDLLCCAFGGVIVLAVVFAASVRPKPSMSPVPQLTILLEFPSVEPWPFNGDDFLLGIRIWGPKGESFSLGEIDMPEVMPSSLKYRWSRAGLRSHSPYILVALEDISPGEYTIEARLEAAPTPDILKNKLRKLDPLRAVYWAGSRPAHQEPSVPWSDILDAKQTGNEKLPLDQRLYKPVRFSACVPDPADPASCGS